MKWYLDFGHGGKDPGALGEFSKESDVVLKVVNLIKNTLEKSNETIITSRTNDTYHTLEERVNKANKEKCNYFISIHLNSSSNKSVRGCEVWVYDKNSKLYNLSKNICNSLSKSINTKNRGVKISKEFYVLRKTTMPALLIEIDFISNIEFEKNLSNSYFLENIANTISKELLSFVNKEMNNKKLYRVCIGAFEDSENAINLKNKAISKGFSDAYII